MSQLTTGYGSGRLRRVVDGLDLDDVAESLSALSFWFAIALPVFYLPMLVGWVDGVEGLVSFLGLFGLHVLALIGGQPYSPPSESRSSTRA